MRTGVQATLATALLLATATASSAGTSIRGVDVSSLARGEAHGAVYRDSLGRPADALAILKANGVNAVRVKVWVAAADSSNGIPSVVATARRAHALGLEVWVDLHFSDRWADPGRQDKPAAWGGLSFDVLRRAVYEHTREVCHSLLAAGVRPRAIQIGNEIDDGLLWPDGRASRDLDRTAKLLKAGAAAVQESSPGTFVVLHVSARDSAAVRWILGGLAERHVPWDVTAFSYYPMWHGDLARLQRILDDTAGRTGRPVVVVETAFPFTLANADTLGNLYDEATQLASKSEVSPAAQAAHVEAIRTALARVPNGRGLGFFWWEGTWIAVPGNGWDPDDPTSGNAWENQALFDFEGKPLPALRAFAP